MEKYQFYLIDDNEIDLLLNRKVIEMVHKNCIIRSFNEAQNALKEITNNQNRPSETINIILLDIKMPIMDGFQFLDEFNRFETVIKDKYIIYLLSSSLNQYDISRAKDSPFVKEMIQKPLNLKTVQYITNTN